MRPRTALAVALAVGLLALPLAWLAGAFVPPELALGAAGLAAVQVLLFRAARRSPAAVHACLALTPVQGFLAAARIDGAAAAGLAALAVGAALLALDAEARRHARASLPTRIPRSSAAAAPAGPWATAASVLALTAGVLLLAPLLAALGHALLRLVPEMRSTPVTADTPSPGPEEEEAPADEDGSAFDNVFPARLEWATSGPLEDETPLVRLRETPRADAPLAHEALHVRGLVLERFTGTGMRPEPRAQPAELDAARDADGWAALPGAPTDALVRTFTIEQVPLRIDDPATSLLFAPEALTALDCPGARAHATAERTAPVAPGDTLRFRARTVERHFERCAVPASAARDGADAVLALPPASAELAAIQALAREVTRGAADDRERVARVLAFFRGEFQYEPEPTGIPGLVGLARFLERRAGGCTHYAATATLMLRTLGVPARVATGFLARPDELEPGTWVATPRTGHAWFEVPFPGLGWVTCDPTPVGPSSGESLLVAATGERSWWRGASELVRSFLDGEGVSLARVRAVLAPLPRFLGSLPGVLVLAALVLVLVARRRSGRGVTGAATRETARADALLERLHAALARAGFPRAPGRTLREHARLLSARVGPRLGRLEPLVERLYHVRFGGDAWTGADEGDLAAALAALDELRRSRTNPA